MTDILQSEIFFFIASISVIVITIAVVVVIYYVVKVIREVRDLIRSVRVEINLFKAKRHEAELRVRTFGKLAKILAKTFFRR